MNSKTKFKIAIFFFFISLFVFLCLSFFLFSKIEKKSWQILEKKREIITIEDRKKAIEEFKGEREKIEKIEKLILKEELPLPFVKFLEEISKEYNVSFDVSLQKFAKEKKTYPIFQINFSGNSPQIFYFLERIERGKFLVSFRKLTISQTKEGLKGSVLLEVFTK